MAAGTFSLQLFRINRTEAATAFLRDMGTRFDIVPVHVAPQDGETGGGDYLYAITSSSSSSSSSPSDMTPLSSFLRPGGLHANLEAPRSVLFRDALDRDSMFHVKPKGKTGGFQIITRDNAWNLSVGVPGNADKISALACGDVTPVAPTARFVKTGQTKDPKWPAVFFFKDGSAA